MDKILDFVLLPDIGAGPFTVRELCWLCQFLGMVAIAGIYKGYTEAMAEYRKKKD